ncbi:MAG: hypothetical protein IK133_08965, partial [Clostridia bacterium]|nr:hypothetical protein [Clostridia bacterium]
MKRLFAIILTLCLVLGVLPEALAYDMTTHTHKWSQWYPEGEAGCVYGGARYRYCTECWTYEYEETPPLGHVPTRQVREEPTCTKPGYYITVCSRCGQGLDNGGSIPALGHDYKRSVAQEATCTSDGMAIYTCSRCGDAYREPIPATGHKWGGWTNDTPSTCVSYGTRYHVCQRCGTKEWERNYADGLGDHDWGEWKVIKEPAVGVAGLEERVCKNDASHKEQREIPAIGVEIDVFLDYNEKWLPEKYVIGSKIELDMYTYNYSNVPVTLTETEITEHPIGDLIDPWPDINGTVIQPGASFHWVLTIYINGADGMVGEAIRHIYQSYSYSEGVPAPITGQTNTIEVHYPIEEETQYVLKGEKQNFSGCSSTVGGWKLGYDTGAQCIWQDAVPDASLYRTDYTPLYSDSDNNINLTDAPMAGESYYFHISVLNDAQGDHSIDFTQVDPAQVDITSDVFTIELLGIEPYVSDNDRDGVLMYFKATYQSVEPALLLEVKQISPEQESYHPKDRVDLDIILTNTGNVPLKTPGYFIIYGGKEHPAQFVESAVLAPGESVTIKGYHFIFNEEDLADGQGKSVLIGQAWLATAEDGFDIRQLGGNDSAVVSNTVETIWPVTEGNPQLYLEIKQTTPEQESYHPGERVDLEVILTNTGNMSLMLPSYFLVYDDGMSLGKLDESTVLAPGESISFNNLCFIFDEEHAAEGKGEVKAIGQAWATSTKDDADTDQISQNDLAVQSNLAEISWLVTPSEPQLYLEIKQVSPEQETYYVNDTVDLEVTLTNTGNVSLKAPGYFLLKEDSDILLKYDESAELAPGESITFTGLYYAFRNEDLLEGNAKVVVAGQAWLATSADGGFDVQQFGGNESAVISNYVEMNWPMSAPELQLEITQVSPWKAVYEEGDSIDLKITLSNFGSTPLSAPCYFFDWAYDGSRWYTYDDTVINPGESAVFFETVQVWKEDVDMGYMGLTFNGQAWDETAQEIEKTVLSDAAGAVHSNTVEMIWPTAENEDAPALFLEVSWAPDEGIGKVAGDTIREHFKLTNTGNVNMLVPACLDHSIYEDIVQPNWYLDFGGVTFTVLKPGWSMEWTFLDEVFPEDVEAGRVSWSAWRSGYVLIGEEERGMRVDSNLADIDIPLSNGSTLPKEPALKLTTIASPMKASYPYAELYSECDVVKIDFVLINTGDVPLYIDKLLERWGDGNETFIPLNILLYPGESYSDYTNVWLVTNVLTPNSQTAGVAGTVDIELYALGRDWDDTDTVLCETDHSEYSFMMVEPGPADWEIPGESALLLLKYVKTGSALPEGYQKGEQIVYVVEVPNIGEVEVTDAVLTETLFGIKETLPTIPVGDVIVKEYVYTVTEDDVLVGGIYNEALVEWTDPDSLEEKSDSDWMFVYTTDKTSLMLKKEIVGGPKNGEYYVEGEEITFLVTAKNNTDTVLPLVFVNEPLLEGDSETLMEINDMQPGAEQGEMFKY